MAAIFLARTGHSKAEIKEYVGREFGYDLSPTLEDARQQKALMGLLKSPA